MIIEVVHVAVVYFLRCNRKAWWEIVVKSGRIDMIHKPNYIKLHLPTLKSKGIAYRRLLN